MIDWLFTWWGEAGILAAAATFVTAAITSTGRPGATVFLLLAIPTALLHTGVWEAQDWFFPPTHVGLLVVLGLWAVVEHFLRGEVYGEIIEALPLDRLGALLLLWLMFVGQVAVGAHPEGVAPDVASEMKQAIPWGTGLVLLAVTLPLQLAIGWARNRVFEVVRDMGFGGSLSILEFFGVAGIVVTVVLLPTVAMGAAILVVVPLVIGATVSRLVDLHLDQKRRRPCPACGIAAREEAHRCPGCRAVLPIVRPLA